MKFGICSDLSNIESVAATGFDYIEGHVTKVAAMSEAEFEELCVKVAAAPIKAEAFCVLFPGDIKITGPEADPAKIEAYADRALARVKKLGAEVVVFGSGGARKVPDGFDRATAWHQLITAGRILGRIAEKYGLVIALEPLNTGETNIINTQAEGLRLVADVKHDGFKILSDYYHLALGGENGDIVAACGGDLRHTHIANPNGRVCPAPGDGVDYDDFFDGLRRAGYNGRISYEGKITDPAQVPVTLALLKEKAAKAGLI